MTDAPKISLNQQIEALHLACSRQETLTRGQTVRSLRRTAEEEYDLRRLQAVMRTLLWLAENEAAVRAFVETARQNGVKQ